MSKAPPKIIFGSVHLKPIIFESIHNNNLKNQVSIVLWDDMIDVYDNIVEKKTNSNNIRYEKFETIVNRKWIENFNIDTFQKVYFFKKIFNNYNIN